MDAFLYLHLLVNDDVTEKLIAAEYLNVHFFSVFSFVCVLEVRKALFYANFRKLSWIVPFILRHPVICACWSEKIAYSLMNNFVSGCNARC